MRSLLVTSCLLVPSSTWAHYYHRCGGGPLSGNIGLTYTATLALEFLGSLGHHHCHHHCYWKKEAKKILSHIEAYKKTGKMSSQLQESLEKMSEKITDLSIDEKIQLLKSALELQLKEDPQGTSTNPASERK